MLSRGSVVVRDGKFTGQEGRRPVHQALDRRLRPAWPSEGPGMARSREARFGHVNVTGRDWRRLAAFYTDLFGLEVVPPERDYPRPGSRGRDRRPDAHLTGAHLRLPGLR